MAQAISATFDLKLKVDETVGLSLDQADDPTITHETSAVSGTLSAGSSVPATKAWSDERTLTGGSDTFDLKALSRGSILSDVDCDGLKVQAVKFRADPTNTSAITISDASSNGYNIFGDSNGQVTLSPGAVILQYTPDVLADVSSTAKNVIVQSGDLDAKYQVVLVAG